MQVCPTGIDIREGLQYECIGCGACVDVCNTVMDKIEQPRGLIRFSTQNAMQGAPVENRGQGIVQVLRKIFRPRVVVYTAVVWALIGATCISLFLRKPFRVDVVRDRATLSRIVAGGQLENVYRLQIMNATEQVQHYQIAAHGLPNLQLAGKAQVQLAPAQASWVTVNLRIPYDAAPAGSHPIFFDVLAQEKNVMVSEKSVFLVPR